MAKYSYLDLATAVSSYLTGTSSTMLSKRMDINGSPTILGWVHKYQKFGVGSLLEKHYKEEYSLQYKLKVLNWMVHNHKSHPDTAPHYNIASPSSIYTWERKIENGDPRLLKHKSHKRNNFILSLRKQIKELRERNLKLRIKKKYDRLRGCKDPVKAVTKLREKFPKIILIFILRTTHISSSTYYRHVNKRATLSKRVKKNVCLIAIMKQIRNKMKGKRRL